MFDRPSATAIVAEVEAALKTGIKAGFEQLVAANALGIARRELELGPELAAAEQQRLATLLNAGTGTDLATLRQLLSEAIRAGRLAVDDPALADHLARSAIAKMTIDQPRYAAFRAWRERAGAESGVKE